MPGCERMVISSNPMEFSVDDRHGRKRFFAYGRESAEDVERFWKIANFSDTFEEIEVFAEIFTKFYTLSRNSKNV